MRGKGTHKGKSRKYTAPEEIDRQMGRARQKKLDQGSSSNEDDDDDDNTGQDNTRTSASTSLPKSKDKQLKQQQDDDDDDEDDDDLEKIEIGRPKTTAPIIESHNPNRVHGTAVERPNRKEAAAATRAVMDPLKLKSEAELASDLARLQLVRKEREQAAQRREQERQAQEARRIAAAQRAEAKIQEMRQKGKPGSNKRTNIRTTKSNPSEGASETVSDEIRERPQDVPTISGDNS